MPGGHRGLTLVELLVTIAITLLIMSAVVTVFSNVSGSVSRRRATIEMASQLRNVRETLARDLAGATCPAVPTQRPESNVGYLEVIEGPFNDHYPSPWIYNVVNNDTGSTDPDQIDGVGDAIGGISGIDLELSTLPGSNLGADIVNNEEGRGRFLGSNIPLPEEIKTDGRGLGDGDDILMLTVRNETDPFVGRIPNRAQLTGSLALENPSSASTNGPQFGFGNWQIEEVVSPLAEVVWFAVENPVNSPRTFAFGEAGYRNIYRRVLLILPELNYRWNVRGVVAPPGTLWVLPEQDQNTGQTLGREDVASALGSLIAFQERFDVSARLEWAPLLPTSSGTGRWVIRANTLSDLTRRENRYEHHGYAFTPPTLTKPAENPANAPVSDRYFPFAVASGGFYSQGRVPLQFRADAFNGPPTNPPTFEALVISSNGEAPVIAYKPENSATVDSLLSDNSRYAHRPFVRVLQAANFSATARAILNEDGNVVHVTRGLAPLGGSRRGDDLMMTDALAFDLKVYDPGAPRYAYFIGGSTNAPPEQVLTPADPAWAIAYGLDVNQNINDGPNANNPFRFEGQGAYVDAGYGRSFLTTQARSTAQANSQGLILRAERFIPDTQLPGFESSSASGLLTPRFFADGNVRTGPIGATTAQTHLYPTFDTWSNHYESDGVNQDEDDTRGVPLTAPTSTGIPSTDEGTNGLDDQVVYVEPNPAGGVMTNIEARFGPDDPTERETPPPYDTALRGLQVTLRVYERDSRQIREMSVQESFVPE